MELNNKEDSIESEKLMEEAVNADSETPQYPIDIENPPMGTMISSYYNLTNAMSLFFFHFTYFQLI